MKHSLKITEFHLKPGSQDAMMYTDCDGELFIGPAKDVTIGKTYKIEASPKPLGGCYHRIIAWLD
jgi:hypothetical protein